MKEQRVLKRYYEILFVMSIVDIKTRYQNSKLGIIWSLIKPCLQFCAYFTVFGIFLHINKENDYAIKLFFGILLWTFFTESTSNSIMTFISKKSIITKIRIKKILLPISSFVTALFTYGINIGIFLLFYSIYIIKGDVNVHVEYISNFILSFTSLCVIMISINIVLAILNVMFRDIQNIWEIVLSYAVFLTPIIYPINIPIEFKPIYYFLNPVAFPIEQMRLFFFNCTGYTYNINDIMGYMATVFFWPCIAYFVNKTFDKRMVDYL